MVQPREVYPIQFTYGPEAEEDRGRGYTVCLRFEIQARPEEVADAG